MSRSYDNSRRARQAAETTAQIAAAAEALLASGPFEAATLKAIAARSGVTVQTVLRHMGSRDGCLLAVRERVAARVEAQRGGTPPGDVEAALAALFEHYEADGRLVLNLLAAGPEEALAHQAAAEGRDWHRAWVERCFGPLLPPGARRERIDGLVAATDLFVWRLLRLDLGRDRDAALAVVRRMVLSQLEAP